jgi:alkylation response protein AidB-like acyl-CoA dehydrogenase
MIVPAPELRTDLSAAQFLDDLATTTAAIAESASQRDAERRYPTAEYDALRDVGFWRMTIPRQYGGLGYGYQTLMAAVITVAAADGSLGQLPQNHFNTLERIALAGSPELRGRIFGRVADGAVLGNATAEPRERPPGEQTTALRRNGAGYCLTGRKVYATGALLGDIIAVQARDETGELVTALVDRYAHGITIVDDWSGFGQRTTASGTAVFDGVVVDEADVLRFGTDPRPRYRASAQSQLLHCAIDTGIAQGAFDAAVRLAHHVHGGRGSGAVEFADDVLGVTRLGELWIAVEGARAIVTQAAHHLDALTATGPLANVLDAFYRVAAAKSISTEAALTVTAALIDIGGASSTRTELRLDRFWRDARTHTVHDAVRWKPYAVGRRLLTGDVADAWSIAHPFTPVEHLEQQSSAATTSEGRRP